MRTREHTRAQGAASRVPLSCGAISVPLASVSGRCTVLTITHSRDLPKPGVEKASRRKKQLESCFLLRQVYFSSQLCLTKTSLCGRHFPKKGLIHPGLDGESGSPHPPSGPELLARGLPPCSQPVMGALGPEQQPADGPETALQRRERPMAQCSPDPVQAGGSAGIWDASSRPCPRSPPRTTSHRNQHQPAALTPWQEGWPPDSFSGIPLKVSSPWPAGSSGLGSLRSSRALSRGQ